MSGNCIYNRYKRIIVLLYVGKDYTSFRIRAHSWPYQLDSICEDLISKQGHMHRFGSRGQLRLEHIFKRPSIKPWQSTPLAPPVSSPSRMQNTLTLSYFQVSFPFSPCLPLSYILVWFYKLKASLDCDKTLMDNQCPYNQTTMRLKFKKNRSIRTSAPRQNQRFCQWYKARVKSSLVVKPSSLSKTMNNFIKCFLGQYI